MSSADNERMVSYLLESDYADAKVAAALRRVAREFFVPENLSGEAYADHPLPIGHGQTISAATVVAYMTRLLEVENEMKVLDIGSGSGWQSAIFGELVGPRGKVIAVERIPELVELGRKNCEKAGCGNVEFVLADGTEGYEKEAPYDRILVGAAAPSVPKPLVDQLKKGGKMIIPVGERYWQELVLIEKDETGRVGERYVMSVVFVPLIGKYGYAEEEG